MSIRVLLRAAVLLAMAAASTTTFGATVTWDGGGPDDLWSTPANWSTNSLPTASDAVVITTASGAVWVDLNATVSSVTIQPGAVLRVEPGWVVTVNNSSTVDTSGHLYLRPGGTFSGNGALAVNGTLLIEGGTIDGSGALTINSGGTMTITSSPNASVISRSTTNAGTITVPSSSTENTTVNATIANSGIIEIQTNDDFDGSGILNNNSGGLIRKSAGIGTTEFNFTVNNAAGATIETQTGDLQLDGGGTVAGACVIAPSKFIRLGAGTFSMSGNPTVSGGGRVLVDGATLDAGAGVDVTWPNVDLQAGTITGPGALRVSGNFNWFGGTISGSGPRVLQGTSVPTISCSGSNCLLDGAELHLQATATYSASGNALVFSNGASLIVDAGKTLNITNDGDVHSGVGGGSITNNGKISKQTGGLGSTIGVPVTLSGTSTVEIDSGTMQFGGGATVAAGATLEIGPFRILELTGGVFQFNSGTVSMPGSGGITVNGGTLRAATGITVTIPNLTLASGVIDGDGAVHVSGNFAWVGGMIAGSGARVLNSSSIPNFFCSVGNCLLDGATLQLQAATTFSASSNALVFSNGASLTVGIGKTLSITNGGDFSSGAGGGSISNNGTIRKQTGAATSTIGVPVTLSGSFDVELGTLQLAGGASVNAGAIVDYAPGAAIEVTGGVFLFNSGAISTPSLGDFKVSSGTLRVPTGITVTLPKLTLQGSGVLDGGGTLVLSGTSTWAGGTMGSAAAPGGITRIDSGNTMNVTAVAAKSLTQMRELLNNGIVGYSATSPNVVTMSGNSKITNNGSFDLTPFAVIDLSGSALIENNGTINKNGFGASQLFVPVDNNAGGTVSVNASVLALSGGGTERGAFTVAAGAGLILGPGSAFTMLGSPTISGPGTFTAYDVDVGNGPGGGADVLTVTAATVSYGTLALRDATLQASSTFSVFGTIEHYGGALSGSGTLTVNSGGVLSSRATDSASTIAIDTTINSGGTLNVIGNAFQHGLSGNITVTNDGTIDFQTDGGLASVSGAPQLVNNTGILGKSAGSGTTGIDVPVASNAGSTVNAAAGTLAFNQGGSFANVTIGGAGTVALPATATVSGTTTLTGTLRLTGNAAVSGTLSAAGTLLLDSGVSVTWPHVTLSAPGSKIDGAGSLTVSGNFTWAGGTIAGSGSRVLNSASTPVISCSSANCLLDGATLRFQEHGTYSASTNALVFSNGASLVLDPGKILFVDDDGDFVSGGGAAGSIVVGGYGPPGLNGCIQKTNTPGISIIDVPVSLSGSFKVDAGTLQVGAGVTASAGAIVHYSVGTTLEVTGGEFLFTSSAVSVPQNGTFKVTAGTLRVPAGVTVTMPNLWLQGSGIIDGGGTLILAGSSFWTGGTMGSATASGGITRVDSSNTLNISGSSGPHFLTQSRQLLNNGTVNYAGIGPNFLTMSAGSKITNNGTLNLTNNHTIANSPAGSAVIENNGTIARSAGSGGSSIHARVENNSGATLSVVTGTTVGLYGGGIAAGTYAVSSGATLTLVAGTFTAATTSTVTGAGDFQNAATVDIGSGVTLTWPKLHLIGGKLDGPGALHLTGSFTWSGGTIAGTGTRSLDSSSTPVIDGAFGNCTLDGAALQLQASATFNASNSLMFLNGASLTIDAGKTLSITNNGDFASGAGGGSLVNHGTIAKHTAAGTSTIGIPLTMAATSTIDLDAGTLQFGGGDAAGGATIDLAGGTTLEVTGGLLLFSSGPVSMPGSGTFRVAGGALRVPASSTVTIPNLTLQGSGVLDGGGTLILSGASSWTGGTMGSATAPGGITRIPSGNTLNITAAVTLDHGRTLQNDGTLSVGGNVLGSGTIANNGTLSTAGNRTIGVAVNNSGQLATSGALSLTGGGTHSGSFTVTSPGNLSFASGTHSVSGGGSIAGTGTLTFNGATTTIGVPVTVGALSVTAGTATLDANSSADAFSMTGGTLGGSGTLTLTHGGTWAGGTLAGTGTTVIPATKTLHVTAAAALVSRILQNHGTLSVSGNVAGSGTIDNQGTLNALGNGIIGPTVNNSGELTTSSALSLAGGGTHTGSFSVTAPGNLSFASGTHSVTGGGSIGGSGTLTFSGGTTTVGVPVNVGSLSVTSGTATLDANSSAGAFAMTGGTIAGSGTLTLTNGGTWSGGTMSGTGTTVIPVAKTLHVSAPVTLDSRTLHNAGTVNLGADVAGSGTIANDGMLSTLGNVTIGAALSNSGQVVTGALLSLGGNGTHSGTFTANAPGTIEFSGGSQTLSGTLAGTGTLRFSGAAVTVSGTWSGMPIEVTGGSVALDTNGTIPELTLSGGTLAGSADVTVTGPSTWSGGTLAGSGDFTFDTGATVAMPGITAATVARPLLNKGTINFTAASQGLLIDGVEVRNSGTFNVRSSRGIAATAGTPPFINAGTLKKSSSSGIVQFGAPLANSGQVRIESGTMHFGGRYGQSAGTTTVLAGATLQTATLALSGGTLTGTGRIAGTVANGATVAPGASPGALAISGDYVQSSGGALVIELAGTAGSQYDRLLVSGTVTLAGTLDVTTRNGFVPAPGNAFQILTFGSRAGRSTFDVMNGLAVSGTELAPTFDASSLQLIASRIPVADVAVTVTGPVSTTAGTEAIYTITVSNSGPDTATGVAVTVTASPGLTFSRNSGACTGSFPCNIGTLAAGQSTTILTAWDIAPSATGSVRLTVHAGSATDPNVSNNSDSASTGIGACPVITILAPAEMISGETAQANATVFRDAAYRWSIDGGTIQAGQGTSGITFTAGEPGTLRLGVTVTGGACTLGAALDVTVRPPLACAGTATTIAPADGTSTSDAVVFGWNAVDGASGYRLWLEQGGAPALSLGTSLGTSRTKILPPGIYRWYVETLFDGCASHESERRALTVLAAQDCATREAPRLTAPANDLQALSTAVAFSWESVPTALEYELWLAPVGGVPTLINITSGTSYTAVVPPGPLEWYVRAVFAGCAATESARRAFTCTPPPQCTSERPLLIQPQEGERLTSPVSFEWTAVAGATSYELYVDGVLAATTTSPQVSAVSVPLAERRWHVRARLGEGCGAVDSTESRLVVVAPAPSCAPLGAPVITAPARISSGVAGRIQWSFVAGASAYVVEISTDPRFPREATSSSTVAARQLPFAFTNQTAAPVMRYVRVHAIDTHCVERKTGAFSPVVELSVLPPAGSASGTEGVTMLSNPTDVEYTLSIAADRAGQSFIATPTVPWLSVTPASGVVPPEGQTLRAVARTAGLPPGTSMGSVDIVTTAPAAGAVTTLATFPPVKMTVSVNGIPGVTTAPKNTPPPESLTIPAVASVTNFVVRYNSDVSITNTSAQPMKYEIDFVPSGQAGMSEGQKTNITLAPNATMAVNDIVATWFGGRSATGTLEIRPLTEIATSTSSAPVGGLANRTTFAASRTFSTTTAGGTYGQYVPAVPYANFVAMGNILSLQHIAQSDKYRTNLGLVEGSGEKVSLEVRIFDATGSKRAAFNVDLNGGERAQLNGVLAQHGITLDDGRIEVEVTSGHGKVTAYASVIDNLTNDPQLVPPVTLGQTGHSKWIVPGVADLVTGSGNWRSDVRIFNAGTETADLTLDFYSMNGGPPATRTIELGAGQVRQFDRVLSFFAVSGDAGALHVSSAAPARVVVTARTYNQTDGGAFGQFINGVTPDEAVSTGSRPLQILQMEESHRFRSNVGFAEVSGKPVTLEVAIYRPDREIPARIEVKLEANQFRQLNSLIAAQDWGDVYNARISVRAVSGEGRVMAYGSLIDQKTGDPTYIPGQ